MFGRQAFVGLELDAIRHGDLRPPVRLGGRLSGADHGQRQLGRLNCSRTRTTTTTPTTRSASTTASSTRARRSPGFQFGGVYSFSNDTNFANNRAYSFGGQYAYGGLLVAAAYLQADNPGNGANGAITANDASFIAARMRVFGGGITYTFGPATAGFVVHQLELSGPDRQRLSRRHAAGAARRDAELAEVSELRGERQIPDFADVLRRRAVRVHDGKLRCVDRRREAEDSLVRSDGGLQPVQAHRRLSFRANISR